MSLAMLPTDERSRLPSRQMKNKNFTEVGFTKPNAAKQTKADFTWHQDQQKSLNICHQQVKSKHDGLTQGFGSCKQRLQQVHAIKLVVTAMMQPVQSDRELQQKLTRCKPWSW